MRKHLLVNLALLPLFTAAASAFEIQAGFIQSYPLRHPANSDVSQGASCLSRRSPVWATSPADLRRLHVRFYHGNQKNAPALDSSTSWNNNMDERSLDPAKVLQKLRKERDAVPPLQRLAERLAPQDDLAKLKLNWVGDIDRHQRKLFWMLIQMLCDKIAPILRACRAVHDFIITTQYRIRHLSYEARTKWIPLLLLATKLAMVQAVKCARVAAKEFILASIATVKAGGKLRETLERRREEGAVEGPAQPPATSRLRQSAVVVSSVSAASAAQDRSVTGLQLASVDVTEAKPTARRQPAPEQPRDTVGSKAKQLWNHLLSVDIIL